MTVSQYVYPSCLEALMSGSIDLPSDNIKIVLVSAGYVASTAHTVLDDIPAAYRLSTSSNLAGKAVTAGVFTATDPVFVAVPAGPSVKGWVAYQDTGSSATSRLLCYVNRRADVVPIDVVPNGGNITLDLSAGKVFRI